MTDFLHPSLDEVADLHEGLLSDERSAELLVHVGSCQSCSAAMAALDEVQAMLSNDVPATMPGAVADSIDTALRRAAAERAAGVPSLADRREAASETTSRRSGWLKAVGAAAAVVVVGYGAVTALQHVSPGSSDDASSDSAAVSGSVAGGGAGDALDPSSLATLTPRTLPRFARSLAAAKPADSQTQSGGGLTTPTTTADSPDPQRLREYSVSTVCTPGLPRADVKAVQAEWKGARATIVVNPKTHHVSVYACGRPLQRLYSTSY